MDGMKQDFYSAGAVNETAAAIFEQLIEYAGALNEATHRQKSVILSMAATLDERDKAKR